MMLASLGLWACNADDIERADGNIPASEAIDMTFGATIGGSLSKSTVSPTTGEAKFSSDDHIKIFTLNGQSADFACASLSDDGKEAQFAGTTTTSNGYYAMLPYQENAWASDNTLSINLPDNQTSKYEELMVAYTSSNDRAFQFKHVGAMIRFVTLKQFSKIEIENTKGNKIAGDISVKINTDGSIAEVSGGTSSTVSIERDITKADSVLLTIMPCTVEPYELRIKFTDKTNNSTFYHTIDKAITFKSGVIYSYGNVGRYRITCKNPTTDETLYSIYAADYETASNGIRGRTELPQPPLAIEDGYIYGYHTSATATFPKYTNSITNVQSDLTIYPIKTKAVNITIYTDGASGAATKMTAFPNTNIKLPAITMQPKDGYVCGYATSANGTPTMMPGDNIALEDQDITIYAVEIPAYTANIYTDASAQSPAQTISGIGGFSFTLPALPAKTGQYAGYSTTKGDTDIKYYQGQSLTYDTYIFGQSTNFYPVYRELVDVTTTNQISLDGITVGEEYTQSTYMQPPLPKVDKGTCSVFKFVNHCNASASATQNATIVLLDKDDLSTSNAKILRLNQKSYGEAEFNLNSGDFMANINNAEVTVSVYNKGGVADVLITWTGSNDLKSNSVKYSNISIWDNLYVTFGVNQSYIVLK